MACPEVINSSPLGVQSDIGLPDLVGFVMKVGRNSSRTGSGSEEQDAAYFRGCRD